MGKSKNLISDRAKNIPLKTRIKVSNEMAFINLIVELGYREDKIWTNDENELFGKLCKLAQEHTNSILNDIETWKKKHCNTCEERGICNDELMKDCMSIGFATQQHKTYSTEEVYSLIKFIKRYEGLREHTTPEFILTQFESNDKK